MLTLRELADETATRVARAQVLVDQVPIGTREHMLLVSGRNVLAEIAADLRRLADREREDAAASARP